MTDPAPGPQYLVERPGSGGEHALQDAFGTTGRAEKFYADQVCDHLLPAMVEFVGRMPMLSVATADSHGDCDSSLRAGPPQGPGKVAGCGVSAG